MAEVVTYANNTRQCFCQIKFESGERVLISISGPPQAGVKIFKLFLGSIPMKTLWQCTAAIAGSFDAYVHKLHLMFPEVKHPLDSFRDHLLKYKSAAEATHALRAIEQRISL